MTKTRLGWGLGGTLLVIGCAGTATSPGGPEGGGETTVIDTSLCNGSINSAGTGAGGNFGRPTVSGSTPPGFGFGSSQFPPTLGTTLTQTVPPPAISGGTLRILADGHTAVAADPDRDRVYIVDLALASSASNPVLATVQLSAGDEPGRVVIDGAGRAHVALRRGGALVTIDTKTGTIIGRRAVCASPRGAAYDAGADLVHVACSDGQLVSFPAAGGAAVRTVMLDRDLRDVVVDGPRLKISRFRSAEILTVEADGTVSGAVSPPAFRAEAARGGELYTASTAYKMEGMPNGDGVMMIHQRGLVDAVQPVAGGYGGLDACSGIVHPAVTSVSANGLVKSGPALAGMVLAVDMAISHDSKRIAIVSAGNATNKIQGDVGPDLTRVFVTSVDSATDDTIGCMADGMHAPCPAGSMKGISLPVPEGASGGTGTAGATGGSASGDTGAAGASVPGGSVSGDSVSGSGNAGGTVGPSMDPSGSGAGVAGASGAGSALANCSVPDPAVPQVAAMEPIAVAFDGSDNVVVQSREPASLVLKGGVTITLSSDSRFDTGHLVFHANAGGFLACASCHAEGNDDGRIWNFTCEGTRRTQSLQTGLRGTEPFHWSGDETDFTTLMSDVFVGRMSGPLLASDQSDALLSWIDGQPRPLRTAAADPAAVSRGRALFNDPAHAGCVSCHAGTKFTGAQTVNVGTGGMFQVPSLLGVGTRGPFMHNGCAKTLTDRFTDASCGGGDKHGLTSSLSTGQISDLVAFLNTI